MAFVNPLNPLSTGGGRKTDAPHYWELVEGGLEIARQLNLSMAKESLTVHPEVLAGRLGYLRTLIAAWEPKRRAEALREEYEQVRKQSTEDRLETAGNATTSTAEACGEDPQESGGRFRKKGNERLSESVKVRFAPGELAALKGYAGREGKPLAALIRRDAIDRARYVASFTGDEGGS